MVFTLVLAFHNAWVKAVGLCAKFTCYMVKENHHTEINKAECQRDSDGHVLSSGPRPEAHG